MRSNNSYLDRHNHSVVNRNIFPYYFNYNHNLLHSDDVAIIDGVNHAIKLAVHNVDVHCHHDNLPNLHEHLHRHLDVWTDLREQGRKM